MIGRPSYATVWSTRPSRGLKPTRKAHFCQRTSWPLHRKLGPSDCVTSSGFKPVRVSLMYWRAQFPALGGKRNDPEILDPDDLLAIQVDDRRRAPRSAGRSRYRGSDRTQQVPGRAACPGPPAARCRSGLPTTHRPSPGSGPRSRASWPPETPAISGRPLRIPRTRRRDRRLHARAARRTV